MVCSRQNTFLPVSKQEENSLSFQQCRIQLQDIEDKTTSLSTIDSTIAELEAQRDSESGGKLQELEAKVKEAIKLDAVAQSTLKSK